MCSHSYESAKQETDLEHRVTLEIRHFMGDRRPQNIEIGINDTVQDLLDEFWNRNPDFKASFSTQKLLYPSVD